MSVSVESAASIAARSEMVPGFADFGIRAFTTTRDVGSFGTQSDEPVRDVMGRWSALRNELRNGAEHERFATASQVHGARPTGEPADRQTQHRKPGQRGHPRRTPV